MTRQEIFDKVCERLRDGTGRAMRCDGSEACVYLNKDGLKCAVGIFIPDGHPAQAFMFEVYELLSNYKDLPSFLYEGVELLKICQLIHDNKLHWHGKTFLPVGEDRLRTLAADFGLEYKC